MADYDAPDSETPATGGSSGDELLRRLKGWYKQDIAHATKWRKSARESFRFYNGDQVSREDKIKLDEDGKPYVVWNEIGPLVNAIIGSEINNRREVRYIPREEGDAMANELLTSAAEWFRDECGAEDEESDAFRDNVIAGMGWTDTRLDFEDEPDGAPDVEHINSMEMVWDCNSIKPNLVDAQRMFRVREMTFEAAEELTGVKDQKLLHAAWAKGIEQDGEIKDQTEENLYVENEDGEGQSPIYSKCTIVEARWFEKETYYRGQDLQNPGQIREYAGKQADLIRKALPNLPMVKQTRKVLRRAFIGAEILGTPDKPMVPPAHFGWECVTGYYDQGENQFYGIVRAAKDPQRWSNKFMSQVMFLLNSQSKGGIIAERGFFEDDDQAEDSWAKTDAITWAAKGKLSGPNPSFQQKPVAQFPQGFFALYQTARESIPDVTGLSKEFIGTREVDQAGVLEAQRRQSSLSLLAPLFNSLRRYRKRQGRVMLFLIQNHLADGRLVRIVGKEREQYVPLAKASVANIKYDIIVDDSPTSPNEKERTWAILMQLLPMVKQLVTPEMIPDLLEASPLPASFVAKLKEKQREAAAQPKPPSPEEMKMQADQAKAKMDIAGKQVDLQAKQQSAQIDAQSDWASLMVEKQKNEMDLAVSERKAEIDMATLAVKERANEIAAQNANTRRVQSARN